MARWIDIGVGAHSPLADFRSLQSTLKWLEASPCSSLSESSEQCSYFNVQDSDYASHPLWGSCMGSTLKFCNLEALRALEEGKSGSDRLLCVEKIGQNVFVIRMVRASGMAEGEQDVRKGTRADALSAIALWMGRFECTYVEWAPKNIITASLPDLSELLVSPRDGAVSSLTSRRRQAVPLSPASSDAHSPCSSRSSMPNGSDFSYEAVANDLLSLTTPREAISI